MQPRFGDLTCTTPRRFWSDFASNCFPYETETLGKVSVLILMGRISALNWVIWVGSDTCTDPDFRSDFMSRCSLTLVLYLREIFAVILIGSNFVPIGPKILGHWAQTP